MEKNIPVAIGAVIIAAVIVFCLIFFAPLQTPKCTLASGQIVSKAIPIESFTKIEVSGKIELYLKQDNFESVAIEAQESAISLILAEAKGGVLRIMASELSQAAAANPCINPNAPIKVFVSAANIESITATDSARVFTENRIHQEKLFLKTSGSALIDANVSVSDLNSFAQDFGTIILTGFAERHAAKAITGGRIIADGLETLYGFFYADNGSISAKVFGEVSAVAISGGSIGFSGGATISSRIVQSGGTITETPDSENDEGWVAPEGDGNGDSVTPPADGDGEPPVDNGDGEPPVDDGDGEPPADGGDGEPPADGGDEAPEQTVCGTDSIDIREECFA